MSEAPERIYALLSYAPIGGILHGTLSTEKSEAVAQVEYVRADLLPVVKPLEWLGDIADSSFAKWQWTAEIYMIEERNHAPNVFDLICNSWDVEQVKRFESLEAAQAAAQADHETRIRACLDMIDPAALVAAAYEAAADEVVAALSMPCAGFLEVQAAIRDLTPANAQAALDAAIAKAVNAKLDAVAKAVAPMTIKIAGTPYQAGCGQIADTILAMKEPE